LGGKEGKEIEKKGKNFVLYEMGKKESKNRGNEGDCCFTYVIQKKGTHPHFLIDRL
jgi:hypothetical protein